MKTKGREIGTLIVVVLKAKNLPNKRNIGKQDPYCIVTLNEEKQRTKVDKRGGQHPEWDEELRFTLFEEIEDGFGLPADGGGSPPPLPPKDSKGPPSIAGGMFMKIACFADDARDPPLIGETSVDLTEVLTKGETDEWFSLSSKNKYAGEVYLELTFWSNEPAPKKRAKSKTPQRTSQYGGAGSFVPFDSSPNRSHPVSRMPSSGSDLDQSATLRTSTSSIQLGLYTAPYEKRASSTNLSVVDAVATELNNLGVSDVRPRRDTFPPINQHPRSTSAQGFQHQTTNGRGYNEQDQQSVFPVTQSHQPAYDNTRSTLQPSSFQQQQSRGPRYSLPNPQSSPGVATSSGFVPLNQWRQDPPLPGRTGPTPVPGGYGMTPSVISHHTGFVPLPTATPAPSSFLPTSSSLPFQHGYHSPHHPMSYSLPPPPTTIPPPPQTIPQRYPPTLPPNSSSPLQLTGSPIAEHRNTPNTPSPPQDAYSQLQGEQPASNPNSRPLPQPSTLAKRRSTLPVPPGGGGITTSPTSSPSRPESVYSGGNYQQPIQPIQYNNIPPPPPLPSHFNAAPPQIQSHITGQAPPLPPPPPQRSYIHSHSHSYSLPNPPPPRATNGQQGLPLPPAQQNSQYSLPVPPVKQSTLPSPPATSPSWRLALPQPPSLPNPPTQQPIYVPPPPPLPHMPSYPNQLPQPPMQYSQVHHAPADGYPPQNGALYQQPTGTVWNYR